MSPKSLRNLVTSYKKAYKSVILNKGGKEVILATIGNTAAQKYTLAKQLVKEQKYEESLALFTEVETLAGENSYCRLIVAKAMEEAKTPAEVEKYLRRSVEIDPKNEKYIIALAAFLARNGNGTEAISLYEKAIAAAPNNLKHYVSMGNSLAKMGRPEEAENILRKLEKMAPADTDYIVALANALAQQLKFSEALPYFQKAIEVYPENATLPLRLADVYTGLSMHKEAAEAVKKHLAHKNKTSGVNMRRYRIHQQRIGNFNEEETQIRFFARNYHFKNVPDLSEAQRRIVEETLDTGISLTHFEDLFDDKDIEIYRKAERQALDFRALEKTQALAARISSCDSFKNDPFFKDSFKPSLISFIENERPIFANDPIAEIFTHHKILGIANTYNEMLSKLRNVNLWINPPIRGNNIGIRKGSQLWHRDQEDEKVLKCFIYLTDVDANSGALDYIPYSKCIPERKFSELHPYPFSTGYPGNYLLDKHVSAEARLTANARKGSIAFVDTNGFHRGGYVTTTERIVLMATYLRPTSPYVLSNTRLQLKNADASALTTEALYALS